MQKFQIALGRIMDQWRSANRAGGTHDRRHPALPRSRSLYDGATPAGAGVATEVLLRLALHLGDEPLRSAARSALTAATRQFRICRSSGMAPAA